MHEKSTFRTPLALIVLDGWGLCEGCPHNAIEDAPTPFMDHLWATYPHAPYEASGEAVGLPPGHMGNSEIGHMTIGAGMPIDTDLVRINKAIQNGTLNENPACVHLFEEVRTRESTLHLVGLLSPGGVHSHSDHLYALLAMAKEAGVANVVVHAFLDGRDSAPQSAAGYLRTLEAFLEEHDAGTIGSVSGRFYAMDRDSNWDRLARVEETLFEGEAVYLFTHTPPSEAVSEFYTAGGYDEHIEPALFLDAQGVPRTIRPHDGVCFFNYRTDRARMLTTRLFARAQEMNLTLATMTVHDPAIPVPALFPPFKPETTLAGEISRAGLTQVHVAETEKYAHATYFLNGGREKPHEGEEHILIPSRKDVRTHDEAPEMRANEIADSAIDRIKKGVDFVCINFANADMVGHTANVPALHTALTTVDSALKRVVEAVHARGGCALITADHGNAERNRDEETDEAHTAHTANPVPAILTDTAYTLSPGSLPDIAPTLLSLIGIPVPQVMTGTVRAEKIGG